MTTYPLTLPAPPMRHRSPGWLVSLLVIALAVMAGVMLTGCTYNRNAPLFETNIEANGNTVPLVGQ